MYFKSFLKHFLKNMFQNFLTHFSLNFAQSYQLIPCHGIPRKGGQCLVVIYSNIFALNTKVFTRCVRRRPSKEINTKRYLKSCSDASESHKYQLTCLVKITSRSFLIGRRHILVISRNHLVEVNNRTVDDNNLLEKIEPMEWFYEFCFMIYPYLYQVSSSYLDFLLLGAMGEGHFHHPPWSLTIQKHC